MATEWAELRRVTHQMGFAAMAGSAVLGLAGTAFLSPLWRVFLSGVGIRANRRDVDQVFFLTQLGKYLPGSVWPVLAQIEAGRRWGVGRSRMLLASALLLVMLTVTGLCLGIALLPWSIGDGLTRYRWTLLALIPLGALLHPRVSPWLLNRLLRLLGRPPAPVHLTARVMVQGAAWSLLVWVTLGLHLYVLIAALGSTGGRALAAAVGGMALAWAVGLIVIPAPAGAGVRDALLVVTLTPLVGAPAALTVALASRLILLCSDLALAGVALLVARGGRRWAVSGDAEGTSDPGTEASV